MKNFIKKLMMRFFVKKRYTREIEKYIAKNSPTEEELTEIFRSLGEILNRAYHQLTMDNPQLIKVWSELFPLRIHKNKNVVYIVSEEGDVCKQVIYQELMSSKVHVTNIYTKEE